MSKKKPKSYVVEGGKVVPDNIEEVIIPDEAIYYIVGRYLQDRNEEGLSPVVVGVSTHTVEKILQLFVDWAHTNNYIKNGILTVGGHKIG
jgi:hypothetical protein